jgi:hypothetical protein
MHQMIMHQRQNFDARQPTAATLRDFRLEPMPEQRNRAMRCGAPLQTFME